jgi:hypothetical protein
VRRREALEQLLAVGEPAERLAADADDAHAAELVLARPGQTAYVWSTFRLQRSRHQGERGLSLTRRRVTVFSPAMTFAASSGWKFTRLPRHR